MYNFFHEQATAQPFSCFPYRLSYRKVTFSQCSLAVGCLDHRVKAAHVLSGGLDASESTQRRFLRCPPNACLPQALRWILQCNCSPQHSQAPTFRNLRRSGERKWECSSHVRKIGRLRQFDCLVPLLLPHPLGILLQNCSEDSSRHKLIDIRIFVATDTRSQ